MTAAISDPSPRDYVVSFDDWCVNAPNERHAMLIRAYNDEEAIREVTRRWGVWRHPTNFRATPYDADNEAHQGLSRNEFRGYWVEPQQ